MHLFHARQLSAALCALALTAAAHAAPIIEITPGLWTADSENWVNGQSVTELMQGLRAKTRAGLSQAQKQEADRQEATSRQSCLTPRQARVDVQVYLEQALNDNGGPWRCEVKSEKADASALLGSFSCRTNGGGKAQGKLSATYGPSQYRLELNGRTHAVDGRTGAALSGAEVDIRHVSTGRRVGAC